MGWKASDENKAKLTKEDAKFVFEQAEKQLKDSLETSQTIVARTTTLITLLSGVIIAISVYSIKSIEENSSINSSTVAALFCIVYLLVQSIILAGNIKGEKYFILGSEPKNIFSDKYFVDSINSEDRIIRFYASEIEAYQDKIDHNRTINEKRWRIFNRALLRVVYTPVILATIYYIFKLVASLIPK